MAQKLTRHHVPPRHPATKNPIDQEHFILKKSEKEHRAYHLLFGNAPDFETCVEILKREWWMKK